MGSKGAIWPRFGARLYDALVGNWMTADTARSQQMTGPGHNGFWPRLVDALAGDWTEPPVGPDAYREVRRIADGLQRRRSITAPRVHGAEPATPRFSGRLAPDVPDAWQFLLNQIDRLHKAGAVDEGHGNLLNPSIKALAELERIRVNHEFRVHQSALRLREVEADAAITWLRLEAERAQQNLDEAELRLAEMTDPPTPRTRTSAE